MDLYRKLQKQLDTYSLGFPATESGIEIEILRELFTQKDAELFVNLGPILETPESIAGRLQKDESSVTAHLEEMASQGLLFRKRSGETVKYASIPFMHGLLEYKVKNLDKSLAEKFEKYLDEGLKHNIAENADLFLRVVPVGESIEINHNVSPFDDAVELLKQASIIAVAPCICRTEKKVMGTVCNRPIETCFMFGAMAEYYIDNNMGREIDFDEAVSILKKCQEAGLVTQPATSQNPTGMCNCCGDCCGVLYSLKSHPRPADLVYSNYSARLNRDECTGCESCLERCQMEALSMGDDGMAELNEARCIGCGLCVASCPAGALTLEVKSDGEALQLPRNGGEQMIAMARKRGVLP